MMELNEHLAHLVDPEDYFTGKGRYPLPTPTNILLFARRSKRNLQQEALQNRSHHRFVLLLNLETAGYVHLNNLALPFNPGQVVLIHPFQFHHYSQLARTDINWLFCTFELEPRTFLEPLRNCMIDISPKTRTIYHELVKEWLAPGCELHAEQVQSGLLHLLLSLKTDRQQMGTDLPPEPEGNLLRAINR